MLDVDSLNVRGSKGWALSAGCKTRITRTNVSNDNKRKVFEQRPCAKK